MRHRGRKSIIGAASAAGVLACAIAPAAGAVTSTTPKLSPNLVKCKGTLVVQIPAADMGIPPANGVQKGVVFCKKGLGKGHELLKYKTNLTTGNLSGTFSIKFKKGTLEGKFLMIPQEGTLGGGGLYSPSTFGAVGYAGTLKFKSGTKLFKGLTGTGSLVESSEDGITFKVVEKVIH
jgi:hypothetical protein